MTRNDRKPYPSPSAESIKAIIIDWLLNRHTNILIGNEIMYGSSRKVVDLLAIIDSKAIAIEIKSASDNLTRLPEQIQECHKVFDKVIIVSAPSHLNSINSLIPKGIGLYAIDKSIIRIQAAATNHHTDFDQLILETSNGKDFWIHVSCRRNRRANRHQVIRYLKK